MVRQFTEVFVFLTMAIMAKEDTEELITMFLVRGVVLCQKINARWTETISMEITLTIGPKI